MNIHPYAHCACQKIANDHAICFNQNGFSEQGKKVTLTPRANEEVAAVVLDGCVFTDSKLKCDGLFLFKGKNWKFAVLVELKGAGDIPHAFEQLAYVYEHRPEYKLLLGQLNALPGPKAQKKAFIVTNGFLSKPDKEKLENLHKIRVEAVLHCEATTPVPDLRSWLVK